SSRRGFCFGLAERQYHGNSIPSGEESQVRHEGAEQFCGVGLMLTTRVIPCLLLRKAALVKTIKFKDPGYVGDPINAIKIYNEKEVDELIFLDITATIDQRQPPFKILSEIASECFMPVTYGGGIRRLRD